MQHLSTIQEGAGFIAILKHISVKNTDYGAGQRYLLFEHEPGSKRLIQNEFGDFVFRENCIVDGINCDPFTWNSECTELNLIWKKNLGRKEVKAHHYIISFAPKDVTDNGLTAEKVQEIGMRFASHFFDGHQVLVVTHADGDNRSGNLHCHLLLNSLRKHSVERQPFMERPNDALAGYKHHQTRKLLEQMQMHLNDLCREEHLHTANFGIRAGTAISEKEYRAARRGQEELDKLNEQIRADGLTPRKTKFSTIKQQIRDGIDMITPRVGSLDELAILLDEKYGILMKESRGRLSFTHPDRKKPISSRSLGRNYEKAVLLDRLGLEIPDRKELPPEYAELHYVFIMPSNLRLITDLQTCVKAKQSEAYAHKVTLSNIQQIAQTLSFIQENNLGSIEKLTEFADKVDAQYAAVEKRYQEISAQLTDVIDQNKYLGQYYANKKVYQEFLRSPNKPPGSGSGN